MPVSGTSSKKGHGRSFIILLSLSLLVVLGIMGISFSFLNDTLSLEPTANTGELKVEVGKVAGHAEWSIAGNTVTLNAPNAKAGNVYILNYCVKNTGKIPIKFQASVTNDPSGIVTNIQPVGWITLDVNDMSPIYTITATVPAGAALGDSYNFQALIAVRQWNMP